MKKEGDDTTWVSTFVKSLFSIVQSVALENIAGRMREGIDSVFDDAQKRLEKSHQKFIQDLIFTFLSLLTIVFFCIGFIYVLIDIAALEKAYAFLIIGGLLVICTLLFKKYVDLKNKVKEAEK